MQEQRLREALALRIARLLSEATTREETRGIWSAAEVCLTELSRDIHMDDLRVDVKILLP